MEKENQEQNSTPRYSALLRRIGILLVSASFILYGAILAVPFTPLSGKAKLILGSTLAVAGEISFWIGGIILGREFVARYKKYLNPFHWLKKKT